VDLPGLNGFQLLDTLSPERRPSTVMMHRSDHYAARAFEASVVDYLLKPLSAERVERALQRVRKHQASAAGVFANPSAVETRSEKLAIRTGRSVLFLRKSELDWAEAEGKHVRLHMGSQSVLLKLSISALEAELDPAQFLRIHRSTLVNIDRVRWVQPWSSGRNYQVVLQDGTRLVLSRKDHLPIITGRAVLTL
jgi:two-component system LytT family response regulator